jgi:hypothetical protein
MKAIYAMNAVVLGLVMGLSSCVSQNPGVETDDLYYTAEDRKGVVVKQQEPQKQKKQEVQRDPKVKETAPAKSDKNNYDFNSKP